MATNLSFGGSIFQKNIFNNEKGSCINLPHLPLAYKLRQIVEYN